MNNYPASNQIVAMTLIASFNVAVHAQSSLGTNPDLSGVYSPPIFVGVPSVTEPASYPFTPEAERIFNDYDPVEDDPLQIDDCLADSMPGILWSASPMELIVEDERVVLRYERGDVVRLVAYSDATPVSGGSPTRLGDSVARWEDGVLVIETTNMAGEYLRTNNGHPLSGEGRLTERYFRAPGSQDLRLEVLVEDPVYYTAPFTLGRDWVWAPDEQIRPFNCVSLGPADEIPDIDELARMLEEME